MANLAASSPRRRVHTDRLHGAAPVQRNSAVAVLGALLDRSLVQIADASSDARGFDRETIRAAADVWDNNTFPLFRAATARTRGARERRARAALEWMAGLGEDRRAWMLDQASAAGHSLDGLLAPAKPYVPGRDYLGRVMAPVMAVTPQIAESLATDYDLPSAEVRCLQVERVGSRLVGHLELAVARSYPVDDVATPETATLDIRLRDVTEVRFDSHDVRGVALRTEADGVSIGVGDCGTLRAATADLRPDDRCWHLSAAGRRADATTPPHDGQRALPGSPQEGHLGTNAAAAATLLHRAMLHIRMVGSAEHADRVPVRDFQRAFAGAGEAILTAGKHRLPHRREAAFGQLIETWARRGGPVLADWFATVVPETAHQSDFLAGLRDQARVRTAADAPQQPTPDPSTAPGPPQAELRLATYTSAHTRYGTHHNASALLHLAVPPHLESADDAPWRLRAVQGANPARFQLQTEAFQGVSHPRVTVDDHAARHFVLGDGALDITRRENRSDDPS
ncbi:hypothetical protein ACH4E7_32125 [Kitasatospora sp. NPDC018058]|uniref:hypothetical protein n=1 Tax=Kitasatospora sp. NPDC018058 TaxID=3364025 RepID=UPI0037C1A8D1